MHNSLEPNLETLEERIVPDNANGVPGQNNWNSGNDVSSGHHRRLGHPTADSSGN
jgi:hypothetical protein